MATECLICVYIINALGIWPVLEDWQCLWDNIFELAEGKIFSSFSFSPSTTWHSSVLIIHFNFSFYDVKLWNHFRAHKIVVD